LYLAPGSNSFFIQHLESELSLQYPEYSDKVTIILKGGIRNLSCVPLAELKPLLDEEISKSLDILGKDRGIDCFTIARLNPEDKIEDIMQVLKAYKDKGDIKSVGASEMKASTLDRARKVSLTCPPSLTRAV
jgi:aryl-alcohol dehydrogenase-like predicted oxidoreductase